MTDTSTAAVESECRNIHDAITRKMIPAVYGTRWQDIIRDLAAERDALEAEVERLQGENDLMCAQLDSLPPPEPGLLKRRLLEIAEKKYSAAQQENTAPKPASPPRPSQG